MDSRWLPVNYAGGFRHMIQQIQQDNNIANFHIAKIILCLIIFWKNKGPKDSIYQWFMYFSCYDKDFLLSNYLSLFAMAQLLFFLLSIEIIVFLET